MTASIGHNSRNRQTVYRRHGNRAHTAILNSFLQDSRISHETKGLVAEMLSYPEDWDFTVQYLVKNGKSGRDRVYKMLKEAEKFGYIVPFKYRALDGKIQKQTYLVSDDPEALIQAVAEEIMELEKSGRTRHSKPASAPEFTQEDDFAYPPPVEGIAFVYVLKRHDEVKIGVTKNLKPRVSALNSAEKEKGIAEPQFFHADTDAAAGAIERIAHFRLNKHRVAGEWFRCSVAEAIQAVKNAASGQHTESQEAAVMATKPLVSGQYPRNTEYVATQVPEMPDRASPDTESPTQTNNIYNKKTQDKLSPDGLLSNSVLDGPAPKIEKRKKKTVSDLYTDDFNHFWALYPKREGKGEAAKSWHKLSMDEKRRAYSGLKKQLPVLERKMQTDGGKYCPMPATWINQGRFDDEPERRPPSSTSALDRDIPATVPRPREEPEHWADAERRRAKQADDALKELARERREKANG